VDRVDSFKTAERLQQQAASLGFDWPDSAAVLDKVLEELAELREAIDKNDRANQAEELGDLLFTLVNLARHLQLNSESALHSANDKFKRRFGFIEKHLTHSEPAKRYSLDTLQRLWLKAKSQEKHSTEI